MDSQLLSAGVSFQSDETPQFLSVLFHDFYRLFLNGVVNGRPNTFTEYIYWRRKFIVA